MRIATWNVNSINARLNTALAWLEEAQPDVVCLQEIKCVDEGFPREPFEALGYNVETHGQKSYNGVAMLSKTPMEDVVRGLPGEDEDDHARYIEAVTGGQTPVRVAGIYLPNGNPIHDEAGQPSAKFLYKLRWMERLGARAADLLKLEERLVITGDFNVIPEPEDASKPETWVNDALFTPEARAAYRSLKWLGLTDAYMQADGAPGGYTFWDYTAGAFRRNYGIRIDHALLSPQAADKLVGVDINKHVRGWEKPSDHVPVVIELDL